MINTKTKLIGLLGNPLEHSFSPAMHNQAYKKNKLNFLYLPLEVNNKNIENVLIGMKKLNFIGFNITIPHKINIIKYLDEIDSVAEKIGSVNTVKIEKGKLKGYNTDGLGFIRSLKEEKNQEINGKKILVLGAGGASRSISIVLAENHAKKIYIANRTIEKAKNLSNDVNKKVKNCSEYLNLNDKNIIKDIINDVDIIVNTTSLGMYPKVDESPLHKDIITPDKLVVDIVYNPFKTKLLKDSEGIGCDILFGLGMLVNQGAEAFEIWTGLQAPVDDMRTSLIEKLKF